MPFKDKKNYFIDYHLNRIQQLKFQYNAFKDKENYFIDYHCAICGNYISPEHGGHRCSNCGALSCCDAECTPVEFVNGHSTMIPYCKLCKTSNIE